jgi:hypothetical protein
MSRQGHTVGSICILYTPGHPDASPLRFPSVTQRDQSTSLSRLQRLLGGSTIGEVLEASSGGRSAGEGSQDVQQGAFVDITAVVDVAPYATDTSATPSGTPRKTEQRSGTPPHGVQTVLFTGDHLSLALDDTHRLTGFKAYNHGSLTVQAESIQALAAEDLKFDWILPGNVYSCACGCPLQTFAE